jgi:hypothetical protein
MKHFFLSMGLWCLTLAVTAEENAKAPTIGFSSNTGLKVAYMGSLLYPGFKLGLERPFRVKQINRKKSWGTKVVNRERAFVLNLGFYHHKTFHDNLFLLGELQFRRQQPKGMFYEFTPGIGYSRTFLGGAAYNVDDNGNVSVQALSGYNYAMFSLAGGVGYYFSLKKNKPLKLYLKPSLLIMTPSNSFIYARPTAEIGFIYKLKNFFKPSPKFKTVNK